MTKTNLKRRFLGGRINCPVVTCKSVECELFVHPRHWDASCYILSTIGPMLYSQLQSIHQSRDEKQ
jgi:hypothetical protein